MHNVLIDHTEYVSEARTPSRYGWGCTQTPTKYVQAYVAVGWVVKCHRFRAKNISSGAEQKVLAKKVLILVAKKYSH